VLWHRYGGRSGRGPAALPDDVTAYPPEDTHMDVPKRCIALPVAIAVAAFAGPAQAQPPDSNATFKESKGKKKPRRKPVRVRCSGRRVR
jgi:hypothetical protein